jgi:hypothetical protein
MENDKSALNEITNNNDAEPRDISRSGEIVVPAPEEKAEATSTLPEKSERAPDKVEEINVKEIEKDASQLEKSFEKRNKEEADRLKKEEKEQQNEISAEESAKRKSEAVKKFGGIFSLRTLSLLAVPFVVIGAVILWTTLYDSLKAGQNPIILVLTSVTLFCIALKTILEGTAKDMKFWSRVGKFSLALLELAAVVAIVLFRSYVDGYIVLACGIAGVIVSFLAMLFSAILQPKGSRFPIPVTISSALSFISSVLLIIANFITVVPFLIVTGSFSLACGTLLFVFQSLK